MGPYLKFQSLRSEQTVNSRIRNNKECFQLLTNYGFLYIDTVKIEPPLEIPYKQK